MADDDLIYLLRRAAEERLRAERCGNAAARASHAGMATAYEKRARQDLRKEAMPTAGK